MDLTVLFNSMITGLFVGAGSSVGTWVAARYFLKNLEKAEEKLKTINKEKN